MAQRIKDIADTLGLSFVGDGALEVENPRSPEHAQADDIAIAFDPKYQAAMEESKAGSAVLWDGADWQALGLKAAIIAPKSRYTMAGVTEQFEPGRDLPTGIHASAVISESAEIADDVAIGPFVVIGEHVKIAAGSKIFSHVSIGEHSVLGEGTVVLDGARIGRRVTLGKNVMVHYNAVIGADGFSFVMPNPGALEDAKRSGNINRQYDAQSFERIHSLGGVVIGDNVEIGALSAIDAGTIDPTRIGAGTKIDNFVQIGHNVQVGENCLWCAKSGSAGSSRIGNYCIFGGKVAIADNLTIGNNVIAGMANIAHSVKDGTVLMGTPAMEKSKYLEHYKAYLKMPRLIKKLNAR